MPVLLVNCAVQGVTQWWSSSSPPFNVFPKRSQREAAGVGAVVILHSRFATQIQRNSNRLTYVVCDLTTMTDSLSLITDRPLSRPEDPFTVEEMRVIDEMTVKKPIMEGFKMSMITGTIVGAGTIWASKTRESFKYLSLSGKIALPIMTSMFFFALYFEWTLNAIKRDPSILLPNRQPKVFVSKLPLYKRACNYVYDNTFATIFYTAGLIVGGILAKQMLRTDVNFQQKLLQTRIYGQGTVIAILLSTMGFRTFMESIGRFEEPKE